MRIRLRDGWERLSCGRPRMRQHTTSR